MQNQNHRHYTQNQAAYSPFFGPNDGCKLFFITEFGVFAFFAISSLLYSSLRSLCFWQSFFNGSQIRSDSIIGSITILDGSFYLDRPELDTCVFVFWLLGVGVGSYCELAQGFFISGLSAFGRIYFCIRGLLFFSYSINDIRSLNFL